MFDTRPAPHTRDMAGIARELAAEIRALRQASRRMPRPVTWDWASQHVLPLLAGALADAPGERVVRAIAEPGCVVEFGLWIDDALPVVDALVAERWECTAAQIWAAAFANLRRRAAEIDPAEVTEASFDGRIVRISDARPWTASLVLVPDQLMRLFGEHDQLIAAPGRSLLVSLDPATPASAAADVIIGLEMSQAHPLALDPFVLSGGHLYWPAGEEHRAGF